MENQETYQVEKTTGEIFGDDRLIAIAEQAEKRIDAVIKIKKVALKVTNVNDWVDQAGKPYLMASGAEKIANLFNISWQINEPTMDQEEDGTITYTYQGRFSLGGRSIDVEGSRSSRDEFFKKYIWKDGNKVGEKPLDRRDLKMAALTNLLGNGITRILGIRNLTYQDLFEFAEIAQGDVKGVEYKEKGKSKPPITQPTRASEKKTETGKESNVETSLRVALKELEEITGLFEPDLLIKYSFFIDKDKKEHSVDKLDDLLKSEKWAGSTLARIRAAIQEFKNEPGSQQG